MNELSQLLRDIDKLRSNLSALIEINNQDLLNPDVQAASRELNAAINEYNNFITKRDM